MMRPQIPSPSTGNNSQKNSQSQPESIGTIDSSQSQEASFSKKQTAESFVQSTEFLESSAPSKVTMMADGTLRTANHTLIQPNDWKNKDIWYAKLYRKLHRRYLRITLRWPSWAPKAVGIGVLALILINAAVLSLYVSREKLVLPQGDALPKTGIIPADGSKYYVAEAGWQFSGAQAGWGIKGAAENSGKEYASNDGACTVQVVEGETQPDSRALELVMSLAMEKYANPISQARAQVALPATTVRSAQGEQQFEFVRSRYSFNRDREAKVVEIYSRTLGKESFSIIQQCSQNDWDQSQPARDQLLENLAIITS